MQFMSEMYPSARQPQPQAQPMEEMDILERRVNELIALTEQLSRENKALRTQQENWSVERAKLIEKNELAKSRVESMIGRLRSLENG